MHPSRALAFALVFCAGAAEAQSPPAAASAARRPNFVLIVIDDLGPGALGCYGGSSTATPRIDALAGQGLRFRTCWATPACAPSRALLMTGRYGFRTGFDRQVRDVIERGLDPRHLTIAEVLHRAGYATGLFGKWHLARFDASPRTILDHGFDEYLAWTQHDLATDAGADGRRRFWKPALRRNGAPVATTDQDYGPALLLDAALDFMRRNRERPFFLYFPSVLVHRPYEETPDPADPARRNPANLESSLAYLDHTIGRLADGLTALGLRDHTWIVITSDNGGIDEGKWTVTRAGATVPLIVAGPGIDRPGRASDALVDLADVLPTFAELAATNLPTDHAIDGRSFVPVLRGADAPRAWSYSALGDQFMVRDREWILEGDGSLYRVQPPAEPGGPPRVAPAGRGERARAARAALLDIVQNLRRGSQPEIPSGSRP